MHYSNKAFTKNGEPTLVPRVDGVRIGQREGFSQLDSTKINSLYSCDDLGSQLPLPGDQSAILEQTTGSPTLAPPPVPLPPPTLACADEMEDCLYRKNLGYCETIPHWMTRYCKRTCGACTSEAGSVARENSELCADSNPHCDTWAKAGFCNGRANLVDHMKRNCKKICGFC